MNPRITHLGYVGNKASWKLSDGTLTGDPVEAEILQAEIDFNDFYYHTEVTMEDEKQPNVLLNATYDQVIAVDLIEWLREHQKEVEALYAAGALQPTVQQQYAARD